MLDVGHGESDRGDAMLVVAQEREPTLQLAGISGTTPHVTRDRYLRDDESELQQLAVDAGCTPAVLCHCPYEATNLSIDPGPPRALFLLGDLGPVAPESVSIPLRDGVRVYDDQSGRPARPCGAQGDSETAVEIIEHRPWSLLFQHGHLRPQGQVLGQEFLAGTKDGPEGMDAEGHEEHQ